MTHNFKNSSPDIGQALFVAGSAEIAGDVRAGKNSSFWYNVSIRGDLAPVRIGAGSNIQDNSVLHIERDLPCIIGDYVTVGHRAIVHACTVGNTCLIGMGAIILNGAEIGDESIVGAGSLVTQNKKFPPRSLILGSPAKVVRELSDEEVEGIRKNAEEYIELAREYGRQAEHSQTANYAPAASPSEASAE
jgi:carbonic anhydrase/acetyltransferase-like protein (isoleucine patch superfamily)